MEIEAEALASFHHEIVDQPDDDPEDAPYQQTCAEGFKQIFGRLSHTEKGIASSRLEIKFHHDAEKDQGGRVIHRRFKFDDPFDLFGDDIAKILKDR